MPILCVLQKTQTSSFVLFTVSHAVILTFINLFCRHSISQSAFRAEHLVCNGHIVSHDTAFLAVSCSVVFVCLVLVVHVTCFIKIKVRPHKKGFTAAVCAKRVVMEENHAKKCSCWGQMSSVATLCVMTLGYDTEVVPGIYIICFHM